MKKIILLTFIVVSSLFLYNCTSEDKVYVTLYLEGNQLGQAIELNKGDKILVPCAEKEGYTIDGWYTSSDEGQTFDSEWIFDTDVVEDDLSLYAIWVPIE